MQLDKPDRYEIKGNPDYGDLTVYLKPGESIWAESGAMSRMGGDLELSSRLVGGFFKALVRKLLGGESLLVGEYTAKSGDKCFVGLSPSCPGSVVHRRLEPGDSLILQAGAFLACTPGLNLGVRFGGLTGFFFGQTFLLEASALATPADLFFNAFGGVVEKTIDGRYTVDNGHVVAWEPTLEYSIGRIGGLKTTLLSGEGFVIKFSGRGKLYLQTRQLAGVAGWLAPYC